MAMCTSYCVVCPFYHRHEGYRICCEGTDEKNTINVVFEDAKERKEYTKSFCNSIQGYKKCIIYNALSKKYSD